MLHDWQILIVQSGSGWYLNRMVVVLLLLTSHQGNVNVMVANRWQLSCAYHRVPMKEKTKNNYVCGIWFTNILWWDVFLLIAYYVIGIGHNILWIGLLPYAILTHWLQIKWESFFTEIVKHITRLSFWSDCHFCQGILNWNRTRFMFKLLYRQNRTLESKGCWD